MHGQVRVYSDISFDLLHYRHFHYRLIYYFHYPVFIYLSLCRHRRRISSKNMGLQGALIPHSGHRKLFRLQFLCSSWSQTEWRQMATFRQLERGSIWARWQFFKPFGNITGSLKADTMGQFMVKVNGDLYSYIWEDKRLAGVIFRDRGQKFQMP